MFRTPTTQAQVSIGLMVLLAALTLGLFWPAVGYDYINLDDPQYVFGNPRVLTGLTAENIRWAFTHVHEAWWLPALWISFMADATLLGPEPWGFHLVNILLHAANVLLLFWVLRRATGSLWASAFAAALFAIHPLRVESVVWISARKDVLSGLFFFLALLAYLRHAEKPSAARLAPLAALMLLGLLSKAILIVLPFLLLLLDYWPLHRAGDPLDRTEWPAWRRLLAEKIPLFLLAAVFIAINLRTHVSGSGANSNLSVGTRLGLIPPNFWIYLDKISWPTRLSIIYPEHDVVNWTAAAAAALGLLGITWLLLRFRKKAPYAIVGWLWFLLALFPVVRGVRLGLAAHTDRFAYLPSIGLSLMLVFAFSRWFSHHAKGRLLLWLLAVLALGACGTLTAYNLRFWRDSDTLAQRLWELDPGNPNAITARGNALQKQERWEDALDHFRKAVAASPLNARYRMLLALALVNMDRLPEAFAVLEEGLRAAPQEPELAYALGLAHLHGNQPGQARIHLARAVNGLPQTLEPLCRLELACACFEDGDPAAANEQFHLIPSYDPRQTFTYADLLPAYLWIWDSGERPRALRYFRNLAAGHPENPAILNNVAWLLAVSERSPAPPDEALALAQKAYALGGPTQPVLLDTLAAAQANAGDFAAANQTARQALALVPENPPNAAFRQNLRARIELYQRQRPYREKASAGLF